MLRHIAPLLPTHHLYCEPFFGGGAVFFAKRPSRIEVMNDKDGFVMNFYRQVQSNFVALQGLLSETLHSRLAYTHAQHIRSAPAYFSALEQAWAFWVLCNMSFNATYAGSFAYSKQGNSSARRLANVRAHLTFHTSRRLSRATIEQQDALELMPRYDTEQSFFYVDPPYIDSCQGHYKGYQHEDYQQLLDTLARLQGKFMLSSYPNALLAKAADEHGWFVQTYDKPLSASLKRGRRKTEVLACNYKMEDL